MAAALEDVQRMVELQLGRRAVKPEDRIVEDLGAESADLVNILATAEERYGITIEEAAIPDIRTVEDLYRLIASLLLRP